MLADVGLLVLARDEEASIGRCISSVISACREAVVLDMHSNDATADIAANLGAKVIEVPVVHKYDALRQVALDNMSTDWVIQLDADEWAPGLLERLDADGFFLRRRPLAVPKVNYLSGRWVRSNRWWPNYQVRIFPRMGALYTDTFHDHLRVVGRPLRLPASPEYAIHHDGYADTAEMMRSVARFLPQEHCDLGALQAARAVLRPLAGYVASGGWRDGSDGLAILAAKIVNAAALEASRD